MNKCITFRKAWSNKHEGITLKTYDPASKPRTLVLEVMYEIENILFKENYVVNYNHAPLQKCVRFTAND